MSCPARAWDWILDSAVGYGYGVWKTVFLWSPAIVVVGAILFGFWFPFKQTPQTIIASPQRATVATASAAVQTKPPAHPVRECAGHALHSFFYSLEVFLPFDGTPWRSSQPLRPRYTGDLWFYLIETCCVIEELLGWLAAGLIAAAAAGVIQK
jgi:cytochrome b561